MTGLDATDYRRRVLARLLSEPGLADPATGDPFFVCDVAPGADQAAVEQRLDEVTAFWNRERSHPRYKGVASQLAGRRAAYEAVLLDPDARQAARTRIHGRREEAELAAVAGLDALVAPVKAQHDGAIPRSRVAVLQRLAGNRGLSAEATARWLAGQRILEDVERTAEPWEPSVRRQVRAALEEMASLEADTARYRTLWTFLGVAAGAPPRVVQRHYAEVQQAIAGARHDRRKTLAGELLAHVKNRLLVEGGRERYHASLLADAREVLTPEVEARSLVSGSIGATDHEVLLAQVAGRGWGLTATETSQVIREVAAASGASVAVSATAGDIVVCPSCHRPQSVPAGSTTSSPAGAGPRCRYCRARLFVRCPSCSATVPAASDLCPRCDTSMVAFREAGTLVERASQAVTGARPAQALELLEEAEGLLGDGAPPPPEAATVRSAAEASVRAAGELWEEVGRRLDAGHVYTAREVAARLGTRAADVPSPGGDTVAAVLQRLEARQAEVAEAVQRALAGEPDAVEAALVAVLDAVPDAREALTALAGLPLEPAREVTAQVTATGSVVTWVHSPAARLSGYRVSRVHRDPDGAESRAVIGRTAGTSYEDAGVPGGAPVRYEVVAVSGERSSPPATSPTVVCLRAVPVLSATAVAGAAGAADAVELRWPAVPGYGQVVLERRVDPASGLAQPVRRIRPTAPTSHTDTDVRPGVPYTYRAHVEYRAADGSVVVTPGTSAAVTLEPAPAPVRELWASTRHDGTTRVSFTSPPAGTVRVYATSGPGAVAAAAAGEDVDVSVLEGRPGVRLVGVGSRRVLDPRATGRVVYTPVTVAGTRAVAGASYDHLAVAGVTDLAVRVDGDRVLLTFTLPPGVTEALVRWRRDSFPTGPDDPAAAGAKVTNTRLEIAGGFPLEVPPDGRPVYAAVYPALRLSPAGAPVGAPVGATIEVPGRPPASAGAAP